MTADREPELVSAHLPRLPERFAGVDLAAIQIPVGETRQDIAERLARQAAGRHAAWTRRLPKRYAAADLDHLHAQEDPGGKVRGWLDHPSLTLLLTGQASRGKTYAAYAVGAACLARGLWTAAWTAADLNAAMRPDGQPGAYDDVTSCDVLLLDDLGRESVTAWTLEQLQRVLDSRNRDRRRTIITTNLGYDSTTTHGGADGLLERYGQPIVDRILDDATVVKIEGGSLRPPARW